MHILWLKTELLHPVDKGGRIRTYNMLRALCRDHRVTYLTLDDGGAAIDAVARASEYSHELIRVPFASAPKRSLRFFSELIANIFSPLPYAVAKYRSKEMRALIKEAVAHGPDVVVCDFLFPSLNVAHDLGIPIVLFQHNVEAVIWERHMQIAKSLPKKLYMKLQWRRMQRHERAECLRFDEVVAVSRQDADSFTRDYGVKSVSDVPTGVDTEYFRPDRAAPRKRNNLVFTGSMDWLPNEDAILWFTESVLPLIQRTIPDVTLTVVGRNATPRLMKLNGVNGIEVTGSVPDVRPYLARAEVFVVPIRIGGGTRLKIYEAMAMGRAVVSTPIGAEGLPVEDGVHVLLRTSEAELAEGIVSLLQDEQRRELLAKTAEEFVNEHFGWNGVARTFAESCQRVIDRGGTGHRSRAAS